MAAFENAKARKKFVKDYVVVTPLILQIKHFEMVFEFFREQ